jgi:hypothetical protein
LLLNIKYFRNLLFLPYRNLEIAAQSIFPSAFGVSSRFDREKYLGTNLDRSLGYEAPTGEQVYGERNQSVEQLLAYARNLVEHEQTGTVGLLNHLPPAFGNVMDRSYIQRIAALCARQGAKLVFVSVPIFGQGQLPIDRSRFLRAIRSCRFAEGIGRPPGLLCEWLAPQSHWSDRGLEDACW